VDKYQDFLPLCKLSQVFLDTIQDNGRTFDAKLRVGKPPLFSEDYVSRVTVIPERLRIETRSISSSQNMFDSLKSAWQLQRIDGNNDTAKDGAVDQHDDDTLKSASSQQQLGISCHVDFEVEMTVSNPAVIAILDKVLMEVAGRQVEAFDKRCQELQWPIDLIEQAELHRRE
jgi:ribosome-associated toxin RatA of RatAB toxin-antitoxin module